jgi:TRAP-type C4-dicarboxylate transport system permease small subunit
MLAFGRRLRAGIEWLSEALAQVSILSLLVLVAAVSFGVLMRHVFNHAQGWTDEIATYCLAAIGFLGLSHTLLSGGHIRIDRATAWSGNPPAW